MQDLLERFRANVARRLASQGLSQSDLARRMGVTPQRVWDYMNNHSPGLAVLAKFAEGLDVDPFELLQPIESKAPRKPAKASA